MFDDFIRKSKWIEKNKLQVPIGIDGGINLFRVYPNKDCLYISENEARTYNNCNGNLINRTWNS